MITVESASLQKAQRINDSIARNPTFWFDTPRFLTAYAETTFPLAFFVSNQTTNTTLNVTLDNARSFFEDHKYPEGFYRRQAPYDFDQVGVMFDEIFNLVGVLPGHNEGVGNYVVNTEDDGSVGRLCISLLALNLDPLADVLCLPTPGELDSSTLSRPYSRTRDCDQDQLGHVLPDAARLGLQTAFPIRTIDFKVKWTRLQVIAL